VGQGDLDVHLRHALGFVDVLSAEGAAATSPPRVLDLGSGGGLPGLVIADVLADSSVTLLDSSERRCRLLGEAVAACGFEARVVVHHERAESAAHHASLRGQYDVVVARSFGPPPVTAECGGPFVRVGGVVVVSEPPDERPAGREDRWPAAGLALLGLEPEPPVRAAFGYRVIRRVGACPDRYPRRAGVPAKRPLF
jgi:16S rRNA (guanine527-N7)-methyltransferase